MADPSNSTQGQIAENIQKIDHNKKKKKNHDNHLGKNINQNQAKKKEKTIQEKEEQQKKLQLRTQKNLELKIENRQKSLKELQDFLHQFFPASLSLPKLFSTLETPPTCSSLRINTLQETYDSISKKIHSNPSILGDELSISQHPALDDTILVRAKQSQHIQETETLTLKRVFVFTKAGQAILRGADLFTGGIVAAQKGIIKSEVVAIYIDIDEYFSKGTLYDPSDSNPHSRKNIPDEYRTRFIGIGIAQMNRKDFIQSQQVGIKITRRISSSNQLFSLEANNFSSNLFLQNIPSITVVHVLDPQPGQLILDVCAAPGGKTSHIAIKMKNQGKVVSIDRKKTGVQKIQSLCTRLGISIVETVETDSTLLLEEDDKKKESKVHFPPESFDKILLDPPCSGLGQRPKLLLDEYSVSQLKGNPAYQRKLFHVAWRLLKPGGTLVYSTCTINPLENEANVSWALKEFGKSIQLDTQTPFIGETGLVHDQLGLTQQEAACVQRFYPTGDFIGFFIAKFKKL